MADEQASKLANGTPHRPPHHPPHSLFLCHLSLSVSVTTWLGFGLAMIEPKHQPPYLSLTWVPPHPDKAKTVPFFSIYEIFLTLLLLLLLSNKAKYRMLCFSRTSRAPSVCSTQPNERRAPMEKWNLSRTCGDKEFVRFVLQEKPIFN